MRVEVEVRLRTERDVTDIWPAASDPSTWPAMPGAVVSYRVVHAQTPTFLRYSIVSGLPVRDHEGSVVLERTPSQGAEIILRESFRGRIWGTAGYLRGRRERALVNVAHSWASPSSTLGGL